MKANNKKFHRLSVAVILLLSDKFLKKIKLLLLVKIFLQPVRLIIKNEEKSFKIKIII